MEHLIHLKTFIHHTVFCGNTTTNVSGTSGLYSYQVTGNGLNTNTTYNTENGEILQNLIAIGMNYWVATLGQGFRSNTSKLIYSLGYCDQTNVGIYTEFFNSEGGEAQQYGGVRVVVELSPSATPEMFSTN